MKGRDKNGHPLEGVDVVAERKGEWRPLYSKEEDFHAGKIEYSLARLVELLQEANKRAEDWKDKVDTIQRKYNNLHADNIALKYSDLCIACQKVEGSTPSGKTYTLCQSCAGGRKSTESLKRELEKEREQTIYWQHCYETALKQRADVTDSKKDG